MDLLNIVLFSALFATSLAELAKFENCEGGSDDICKVSEVRISPCTKRRQNCVLLKGSNTSMTFDFTPNFSSSNIKTNVYWVQPAAEIPFAGFGSNDACLYTTCPTVSGQQQTLNYFLHVHKKLPKGTYQLKWKTWNEDDATQECCFMTTIELKNSKK